MKEIEQALLRVASNVAKHLCNGKAWSVLDSCFLLDLRESEAELLALVNKLVAEEREACARILDKTAGLKNTPERDEELQRHSSYRELWATIKLSREAAAAIRERK